MTSEKNMEKGNNHDMQRRRRKKTWKKEATTTCKDDVRKKHGKRKQPRRAKMTSEKKHGKRKQPRHAKMTSEKRCSGTFLIDSTLFFGSLLPGTCHAVYPPSIHACSPIHINVFRTSLRMTDAIRIAPSMDNKSHEIFWIALSLRCRSWSHGVMAR